MATCTTEDLLEEAGCFACYPDKQRELIQMALMCRWVQALNPMATCNVAELLEDAACFECLSDGQRDIVRTQLLCEILHAGGGGGNSCLVCSDADPVADPDCDCAMHYNKTTGSLWIWNEALAVWNIILGP